VTAFSLPSVKPTDTQLPSLKPQYDANGHDKNATNAWKDRQEQINWLQACVRHDELV